MSNISTGNPIIMRLELSHHAVILSRVLGTIAEAGAQVGAIDIVEVNGDTVVRDITVHMPCEKQIPALIDKINALEGAKVRYISDRTFLLHLGGKIEVRGKIRVTHRDELSMVYTPGVARVCMAIYESPEKANNLTTRSNTVAIVTDGTAVLGLGDIGPLAALPVMEGKAMLFKEFANVDAFPICLGTKDTEEVIKAITYIAPTFGGINLEDIAAPRCFEIERRLKEILDIPVFHDDQHGTAAVMTAALINALKIVNKKPAELKVIFMGVGAAGTACTKMLLRLGVKNIIGCDRQGVLSLHRQDLTPEKREYAELTNPHGEEGSLQKVIQKADVFVGLSGPNVLTVEDLKQMNKDPIVFAMANPDPEIMPELAAPYVAVMATGRSDYPNQINNLLAFPGIFRGALDCQARDINTEMVLAAAYAIADMVDEAALSADYIVPSVFNNKVVIAVAQAVIKAAHETGVARK